MQEGNATNIATINIAPLNNEEIKALLVKAQELKVKAIALVIHDSTTDEQATADLVELKMMLKQVDASKKEYLAPAKLAEGSINQAFNQLLTPLKEADASLRSKLGIYRVQEQERIEEERKLNSLKEDDTTLLDSPTHKTVETGASTMKKIKKWRWAPEVTLQDKQDYLPRWALKPDDVAIGQAVRSGKVSTEDFKTKRGFELIEIYEEPSLAVRVDKG